MAPMLEVFDGWLKVREVSALTETNARELMAGKHPRPVTPAAAAEPRRSRTWLPKLR